MRIMFSRLRKVPGFKSVQFDFWFRGPRKWELGDADRACRTKMAACRASVKSSDYKLDASTPAARVESMKRRNRM